MPHGKKKPVARPVTTADRLKAAEAALRARGLDPNNLPTLPQANPNRHTLEGKDPEKAGQILAETVLDPIATAKQIAQQYGVSELQVKGMMGRLRTSALAMREDLIQVTQKSLGDIVDDRLMRALKYLDDYQMAGASARDLAYVIDRLFNMRSLMRGEPTQIMGHDERRKLSDLVPLFVAEARRRGITIEGHAVPIAPIPAPPDVVDGVFGEASSEAFGE